MVLRSARASRSRRWAVGSARASQPRRSADLRPPGDAPTVGDWETSGRRGRAGQETTARTKVTSVRLSSMTNRRRQARKPALLPCQCHDLCKTKPMEAGHKSFALRELTSDRLGLLYAKRTQFRVVEDGTSKSWPSRKLARREARLTLDQAAQNGAGIGHAEVATWQRMSRRCRRKSGEWLGRVASGQ